MSDATNRLVDEYQAIVREHMDRDGFLKGGPFHCERCGTELSGQGGPRPAETYLGTLNGLCYPCTGAGPYVAAVYPFDGAQRVSWPPHCPSWRRAREDFFGYSDCERCKGLGATRGYGQWTPIWEACRPCADRFWAPRRSVEWTARARRVVDAMWRARTDAMVPRKVRGKRKRDEARRALIEAEGPEIKALRTELIARYDAVAGRIAEHFAKRYVTTTPEGSTT